MKFAAFGLLTSLVAAPAFAAWQLDAEQSSLFFMSTKNTNITEIHHFSQLSGGVDSSGKLTVTVPLTSVETNIGIRNQRMQSMLFDTSNFMHATYTAMLPAEVKVLEPGSSMVATISGEMDLHGQQATVDFTVRVSKTSASMLQATTIKPTLISAKDFALEGGIEALQAIAKLSSISQTVPVTFDVVLTQD